MDRFLKAGINEHKNLLVRIAKLESTLSDWNAKASTHSHVTYANLAILVASYKKAAEALSCILENMGVTLGEDGYYREVVDQVKWPVDKDEDEPEPQGQPQGSDNDIDNKEE